MIDTEQANNEMHELSRQMVARIEKFGTVEGFADSDLAEVIKTTKEILEPLPALIEVTAPIIVFGDIHGQLGDLLQFVKLVGRPPERQFLFLGDYVDRASKSLEVITWLFCMKILHPQKVHLLRGNHEVRRVNRVYGFRDEMLRKRNSALWKAFNDAFAELPLCASINRTILCMHGGISPKIESWKSLMDMNKAKIHKDCEEGLIVDLMWADPNRAADECAVNMKRGISVMFGKSFIDDLCATLEIDMVIRAHEVKKRGHEFEFDNRLLTIFSAPYYTGNYANAGSVATISRSLKLQIVTLKPRVAHETMRQERENREVFDKNFKPLSSESSENKVTCQSHFPSIPPLVNPFIGTFSMCAHETKMCKKDEKATWCPMKPFVAEEEISALSVIRKTSGGHGTISLNEEVMSLGAIRKKLGYPQVEKVALNVLPIPERPPPPPPPAPKTPQSSAESTSPS